LQFAVLFAASFYLLKEDVLRAPVSGKHLQGSLMTGEISAGLGVSKYLKLVISFAKGKA
jgi:hypothetical protein